MNRPIVWLAGADADLQRIFDSLEDRKKDAGKNFLGKVETYLSRISRFPEIAPLYVRRVHRQVMARSVYGIFYVAEPPRIMMVAMLDLRQEDRQIRRRLTP